MRFELLGIEIAVEGGAAAPIAAALAPLARPSPDPSPRSAWRGEDEPDLLISAEPVAVLGPVPSPAVFVHEPVRAGRAGDALVVGDATARLTVRAGGRRVDAELAPEALGPGAALVAALHVPVALAFALRHHRVFHLHAAALADGERAVLVAGQAEAGKTTLAIALLEAGLGVLCDDAAYLAERGGAIRVQGVARPFHLRPATARAFPRVAARAGPADAEGRRDVDPAAVWGPPRRGPLAPGLLVFPEVARRPATAVERIAAAEALGLLVEASALVVVDGAAHAPEHLALLGRLASETPAVRVTLGQDLLERPAEVARAILAALP